MYRWMTEQRGEQHQHMKRNQSVSAILICQGCVVLKEKANVIDTLQIFIDLKRSEKIERDPEIYVIGRHDAS